MSKLFSSTTILASVQWFFFIFANTVVVPISIGDAFQLSSDQIIMTIRSSFFLTGIACVIQGWIGHRYPLLEGHSGMWWGLILSLCTSASSAGMTYTELGGSLTLGIFLAGVITIIVGAFNLVPLLQKVFTPMVMSIYLFLLTIQLILIFFKGMLKLTPSGSLNVPISLFSIGLVILVSVIGIKGKGIISNFAILIGIIIGWIFYVWLFPSSSSISNTTFHFSLFPWGKPQLQIGIVITACLAGIMNASNTIASLKASENLHGVKTQTKQYRFSFTITGTFTCFGALFGLVPYAPFTSTIGFLESTKILSKKPFIISGGLFAMLGLIAPLGSLFLTLPITVGNAVLFVAYLQLFGTALRSIQEYTFNSKTVYRIALPVLIGVSLMNMSPHVFDNISFYIRPLISNGLLMGILLAVLSEKLIKWSKYA
ncbi:uracil/xanthine transporter [Priestia megaterium]|uniref:uracil/xanthine transporter n=1 Tax=Priestia megaterium TaxID=1404 RepID=UPI00190BD3BB|nr:uracil/xanthine transporter [Priestia megaterium]MBK0009649.1 uracil/xanthine transporter [Bacillus sp. S35]MBU8756980.1 uracil/xanthine transporter [Priestia megaterium]